MPKPEGPGLSKSTVKQHLAALRMLFDWLVVGHVMESNPAHAVRGPKYSRRKGKTPVLDRVFGTLRVNTEERLLEAHVDIGWGSAILRVSQLMGRSLEPIATVRLRLTGNRNRVKWKVLKENRKGIVPAKTLLWPSVVGNR